MMIGKIAALIAVLSLVGPQAYSQHQKLRKSPTKFSIEPEITPFPKTKLPLEATNALHAHAKKFKYDLCPVQAYPVDLDGDGLIDYVVRSVEPECMGANTGPFWVIHNEGASFKVVLHDIGHDLDLEKKRTKGLPNVVLIVLGANWESSVSYCYRNGRYHAQRCWHVDHVTGKTTYNKCPDVEQ